MSEFWNENEKDYGSYFHELERDIETNGRPSPERKITPVQKAAKPSRKPSAVRKNAVANARLRWSICIGAILLAVILILISAATCGAKKEESKTPVSAGQNRSAVQTPQPNSGVTVLNRTDATAELGSDYVCRNAVVVDLSTHNIVAARNENEQVAPASTTKVMTVLTAVDMIDDYNMTFVMTKDIADQTYLAEATNAGFEPGEEVTVTDLLYGCILPSGADATIGLTEALCGTEEAFVQKMNDKAAQMGLKNTHFTNATGLYDADHYSTAADIAIILEEALKNPTLKQVLSMPENNLYTTAPTKEHPNGIQLSSTLFSYMYGDEPEGAKILAGKTGFVNESGYCFASYGESDGGKPYITVMLGGQGKWPSVFELIRFYTDFAND